MEGYKLTYHVDMVFCIDATGSMRHVLDLVKQNALNLYRDIVAEMEKTGMPYVELDITHKDRDFLEKRFPTIFHQCLKLGVDMSKDMIPVCPVQHYLMGGLLTDTAGRTSVAHLYACGEAA